MKELVIVGAGTAGTMMANKLVAALPSREWRVTVVDRDDHHVYQPGLLFLPFGTYRERDIVRSRRSFLAPEVRSLLGGFERIDPERREVYLSQGSRLHYDVLVVATGCQVAPEQTPGLTGTGWGSSAFEFYTLEGARALERRLSSFERGRLVINVADMPIKCPVAPLEFAFLADAFFTQRGVRSAVEISFVTPLDGAFTKPRASGLLRDLLGAKNIHLVADFAVENVDGERRELGAFDGRTQGYDLLVSVPVHVGAPAVRASGLGDELGFVPTHKHTLQSLEHPEVFVLGDATNLPSSKAGAVAHFQSEVLQENLLSFIAGRPLLAQFDGHANCFIETGFDKAMLIDFNYETEPLPGRFPLPGIGPFSLLEESHVNHWGKLAFKWLYWNKLLPGAPLPLDHRMLMAGKWS